MHREATNPSFAPMDGRKDDRDPRLRQEARDPPVEVLIVNVQPGTSDAPDPLGQLADGSALDDLARRLSERESLLDRVRDGVGLGEDQ